VLTLYGEYEAEALAAGAEETVKVHLFASVQALVAEATAFLEQAPAEGTKSEVDSPPVSSGNARGVPLAT